MNIDSLIEQLHKMSGDIAKRRQNGTSFWVAGFPTPTGADFSFRVYVYEDGDACLSAKRFGSDDGEYFWTLVFERQDFDTLDVLQQNLLTTLARLLKNETRIIQSKGLINMSFQCAYANGGEWQSVGGAAALRFTNFVFPKIAGKEKEYRSGPVLGL